MLGFKTDTSIGLRVAVTPERWKFIINLKHPAMEGREDDLRALLQSPDQIRRSTSDPSVVLFYRLERPQRWICAVVKNVDNEQGFLITAYPTDAVKEGESIWTR